MKIDIHAHILPERWPDLKERYGYGGFIRMEHHAEGRAKMMFDDGRFFREVQENCWNPERILDDMNQHGVNAMVLSTVPVLFNYWAQAEHTYDWAQFINNHLAGVQTQYPGRFIGLGTVPLQHPILAIQELTRCVRDLGMPGVQIASHVGSMELDDPSFYSFYEAAQELGAALLIHPWEMLGSAEIKKYWMPWLVGMPAETTRAICSMMFGGIFDKFPNLKVMFVHAGGSFPHTLGRIAHGYNCRPDLVNVNNVRPPREYIGRFWIDAITHDPDALRYVLNLFGAHRIAHGTDYPFPLGDLEHGKMITDMEDLSEETKEMIFSSSALDFLGLERSAIAAIPSVVSTAS